MEFIKENAIYIIGFIVIMIGAIIGNIVLAKNGGNTKSKQALRGLVDREVPGGNAYTFVYSTFQEAIPLTRKTILYSYVTAFKPGEPFFYVLPVTVDKGRPIGNGIIKISHEITDKVKYSFNTTEIILKDRKNPIVYSTLPHAVSIGNATYDQVTLMQKSELESYASFIKEFNEKL